MFSQPSEEIPDDIKKQIRDLNASKIEPYMIAAFYHISEDQVNQVLKEEETDEMTLEEAFGIETIEPIEQGSVTPPLGETQAIELPKSSEVTDLVNFIEEAEIECGNAEDELRKRSAKLQITRLIKPLAEKARAVKPKDSKGPLWLYLPPKDSIQLRRLYYQLEQLKEDKADKCVVDKVEQDLKNSGMKIVRSRKDDALILEDFPELGEKE